MQGVEHNIRVTGCSHCKNPANPLGSSTYLDAKKTVMANGTTMIKGTCVNTGRKGVVFKKQPSNVY